MGLFNLFTGKSPADYERKGDGLAINKVWGEAKLAFEAGLEKLTKQSSADPDLAHRLREKLHQCKEELALVHRQEALALIDAGCPEDALALFTLAVELTVDPQLKEDLTEKIKQTTVEQGAVIQANEDIFEAQPDEPEIDPHHQDGDDCFDALLVALPDDIQQAYRGYGHHFEQGYLALNRGEFEHAAELLSKAAQENPSPQSLVPLELATALINVGRGREAGALLETLIQHQPSVLLAYQLLCEIYWEDKDFDKALQLVDSLPPDLAQTMAAFEIKGETLLQAARHEEAKSFFQDLIQIVGWSKSVALGLARAYEAMGQTVEAREVYGKLISQCGTGCGTRIDPALKRKYADLSFATGIYTTEILEFYLELSQIDPANAQLYYHNISRIYAELGNDTESRRFKSIAEDLSG